ncbi:calcium-binding protein 39 [Babesia caballi]|uniref:Calcium-binding protein 39 n=1 Tax=Babesia caballi TaxID=5871 RepID=A0AAV4M078_BABCB|nr:calcium-binding protein 39 [Babesia caballi]
MLTALCFTLQLLVRLLQQVPSLVGGPAGRVPANVAKLIQEQHAGELAPVLMKRHGFFGRELAHDAAEAVALHEGSCQRLDVALVEMRHADGSRVVQQYVAVHVEVHGAPPFKRPLHVGVGRVAGEHDE